MSKFFKTAATLRTLKKIQKIAIKPKLLRNRKLAHERVTFVSGATLDKPISIYPTSNRHAEATTKFINPKSLRQKIWIGRGGGIPALQNKDMPKQPIQKEMINRIISHHELLETGAKQNIRFYSHASPAVILQESNLLASLPKKYKPAVKIFKKMRTKEISDLKTHYPALAYGEKKVPKAAQKHIIRKFKAGG